MLTICCRIGTLLGVLKIVRKNKQLLTEERERERQKEGEGEGERRRGGWREREKEADHYRDACGACCETAMLSESGNRECRLLLSQERFLGVQPFPSLTVGHAQRLNSVFDWFSFPDPKGQAE